MRLLLDTHVFLWFILTDAKLSATAEALIRDPANDILISPASYWEIAIKIRTHKYQLPLPYLSFMSDQIAINQFEILPVELKHTAELTTMFPHHKDPFDRLLIAQTIAEGVPLISADAVLDRYPIQRLW